MDIKVLQIGQDALSQSDKNNEMKGFRFDNNMSRWNVVKVSELDTKF